MGDNVVLMKKAGTVIFYANEINNHPLFIIGETEFDYKRGG